MAGSNSNNLPSFPSNYVTLAHLQQRWLKERDRKNKEDHDLTLEELDFAEAQITKEDQERDLELKRFATETLRKKEDDDREQELSRIAAETLRKKEDDDREQELSRIAAETQRKKEDEDREQELSRIAAETQRKKEDEDRQLELKRIAAEEEEEQQQQCELERAYDRTDFDSPHVGVVAGEVQKKKKKRTSKKKEKRPTREYGKKEICEREIKAESYVEIEPRFWSFTANGWKEAGPSIRHDNDTEHKVDVEPKVAVVSVNRWVQKEECDKREDINGSGVEARADIKPISKGLPVNGGSWKSKKKGYRTVDRLSRPEVGALSYNGGSMRSRKREESNGEDQKGDIDPEFGNLSPSEELKKNGKKHNELPKNKSESKPAAKKLDCNEPKVRVLPVGENKAETMVVSCGENRKADIKPEWQSWKSYRGKNKPESTQMRSESKPESQKLDCTGGTESKVGLSSVDGNGEKESGENRAETTVESYRERRKADIKPEWKGKKSHMGKKKPESTQMWSENKPEAESHESGQIAGGELMVFSDHEGVSLGTREEITVKSNEEEDQRAEKKVLYETEEKIEGQSHTEKSEKLKQTAVKQIGGFKKNKKERDKRERRNLEWVQAGCEAWPKGNEFEKTADIDPKVDTLPVNIGVKIGKGGFRRNAEKSASRGNEGETIISGNEEDDQNADIESGSRSLSESEGLNKNGNRKYPDTRQFTGGTTPSNHHELEQTTVSQAEVGVTAINGGNWKGYDGFKRVGARDPQTQTYGSRSLSVSERLKKNGNERNPEAGQSSGETTPLNSNELEHKTVCKAEFGISAINGGNWKDYGCRFRSVGARDPRSHTHGKVRGNLSGKFRSVARHQKDGMVWVKKE